MVKIKHLTNILQNLINMIIIVGGTSIMRCHYNSNHIDNVNTSIQDQNMCIQDSCEYQLCK